MSEQQAEKGQSKSAYMKAWRAANKERIKAYQTEWKAMNAEHVAQYNKTYMEAYHATPDAQFATWMRNLHRNYRMTPDDFNRLWDRQNGECAVCAQRMAPRGRTKDAACVDHNHQTGEVRGLLCRGCNHGIGNLKDDPEVLESAARYLRERGNYSTLKGKS